MCRLIPVLLTLILMTGCVSTKTHEAALGELDATRQSLQSAQSELNQTREELAETERRVQGVQLELDDKERELLDLEVRRQDLKAELEVVRQVEAETARRNEIFTMFVARLQNMIDGGQLTVQIEGGRIVLKLPDDVLFNSGRARLNKSGREAVKQIAGALAEFSERRFQIEGHTDDKPISTARFPSNWELSSARALAVVHLLIDADVAPENLSAAGFGEFQPRADNDTADSRKLNRRIEIIMQPNLDVLSDEIPKVLQ